MKFAKENILFLEEKIGGKENIISVTHCISRLRLKLNSFEKIEIDEIKKEKWCKGVLVVGTELQIVIGTEVETFYKQFIKTMHLKNVNDDELKIQAHNKSFINFVSSIFSPLMILLVIYVMWEMFRTPIHYFSIQNNVLNLKEIDSILGFISKGLSWFIVIAVCWSVFNVMGGTPILGIAIGAILINPILVPLSNLDIKQGQTIFDSLSQYGWKIFGSASFPWKISFEGLIVPMIFVGIIGVYIERAMNKINLGSMRMLFQPMIVVSSTVIITMFTIAPVGLILVHYMYIAFNFLMTNYVTKYIFSPILGMLYSPLITLGLHRLITPFLIQDIARYNGSFILGLMIISNICVATGCLTFGFLNKNCKDVKEIAYSNGLSAFIVGVTEPAVYSISLKYKYPLIASSIGAFFGCLLYASAGVWTSASPFGIMGLVGFLSFTPDGINIDQWQGGSILWGPLSVLTGVGVSCLMTIILSRFEYFKKITNHILFQEYGYVSKINKY
ncbi:trehalose sucrose beta-glucoside PTS system IIBC component [Mesoplasma florum W37]|uniref:PTS system trehalose-specific IIB component, PTS system trehalose-specific IIC component n=1 Tax=Mesoplasma florum TaxID=2151 RepID=A0AAD2JDK6_MESFO|nr:PTS transporter subunit EIIB [Mesoplasma florum]AGY41080.1 trehalose sucrose beta-glucoside PTS system IIBC component [Mesoplasma florum W37]AVN59314.1 hypothetical protein CG008_00065 [Mesoplasma florum]AVN65418.1 PTS system trehalose-specific IIB component, PTS system trehalose-specific IIC component [Mesoplasma florum]